MSARQVVLVLLGLAVLLLGVAALVGGTPLGHSVAAGAIGTLSGVAVILSAT